MLALSLLILCRHHGYTVHFGPDNSTPNTRYNWLFSYTPADTRYWNEPASLEAGTGSSANFGTLRQRAGDEMNPLIRPRM